MSCTPLSSQRWVVIKFDNFLNEITNFQDASSHAIDTANILIATKKLNALAAACKSCFKEGADNKNLTTAEDTSEAANLTIEENAERIFTGVGKLALNNEEEVFDEEGTPIDAEVTIIIKVNKNSNSTVVVKKLLLENLGNLQFDIGEHQNEKNHE